jgi:D-3-phosphoglycerate dehydrogenase
MQPALLVLIALDGASRLTLSSAFDLIDATDAAAIEAACAAHGGTVRIALTNGATGIDAALIARLPALELIGCLGAGYENIPLEAAAARGIAVTNGAGTNDDCVADHALALLLAVVRNIPALDRATRAGVWRDALPLYPNVSGKKMGIIGLGNIGAKIARRALAFNIGIGYHNRKPRPECDFRYFDSIVEMAAWADYLVIATPGGKETKHLVDGAVLAALGPHGYVVNVARGSVVDTAALAEALAAGTVAGAGLDVYEGEPAAPALLLASERVVLTPHVGGRSPEAVGTAVALFMANAAAHQVGEPLLTPV